MKKSPSEKMLADSRHHVFFECAYEAYRAKHSQIPHWNGKDAKQLSTLLKSDWSLSIGEFSNRWTEYLTTQDKFHAKQGDSLAYFCANFDKFIPGALNYELTDEDLEALADIERHNRRHSTHPEPVRVDRENG